LTAYTIVLTPALDAVGLGGVFGSHVADGN
jgi:hypothetical protein